MVQSGDADEPWADRRQVDGALRRPRQWVQHLVAAGDEHEAAIMQLATSETEP